MLCFSRLDENLDTSKVYNDLRKKISLIAAPEVNRIIYIHCCDTYEAA
jgi:hypothetical protein